ncbi:acyl-CoA dehydrogenase family protein, partial [Streptomyces sp. NRRL S-813]|uniref:acyl-CoA dehydrogenase family protein n=1 Tax=Streptomyces sp. NRRL S-813 TaxID=1463919 RepID=UPI0004C1C1A7
MSYRSALASVLSSAIASSAEQTSLSARFPRASVAALSEAGLLGLTVRADLGGGGLGLNEAAEVVTRVSRLCPATGAVLRSHYAAVAFIEEYGSPWVCREVAAGHHLSTLALADADEGGPGGAGIRATAIRRAGDVVALHACKRDVVAAGEADSYIWSSAPVAGGGAGQTLWLVPADAPGLHVPARPSGAGPRGSGAAAVYADPVLVPADAMLAQDDGGLDGVLSTVRAWLAALPAADTEPAMAEAIG